MRDDQRIRLQALQEELVDVLIEEIDPKMWPGAGKSGDEMTNEDRGNRYWMKKNGAMTMVLVNDIAKTMANTKEALGRDPYSGKEIDDRIEQAERGAQKKLEAALTKQQAQQFSTRKHGAAH